MKNASRFWAVGACLWMAMGLLTLHPAHAIDANADRILRAMGEYLKTANEFSFQADISYDGTHSTGEKVKYGGTSQVSVRRPNRLHVIYDGDEHRRQVFYDGSTITLYDMLKDLYAVTQVPGEIDGALDTVFEKFGLTVPVADLVYADPHAVLTEDAEYAYVIGEHRCGDARCHHLLVTQEIIDWQIWIQIGPRPVPRRLVITYKDQPGSPQYEADLSGWNFQPRLSEHAFAFNAPDGASEIEFLPSPSEEAQQ